MVELHHPDDVDPPPAAARPPRRCALPPGAVDTHAHVIGTQWIAERSYTPHPASAADHLRMLDDTGLTYGVLVQVSVHGTDNALMLAALRAQPARLRGIAVVAPNADGATLHALREAGVVGLRLNTTTGGGVGLDEIESVAARCAALGWHLQLLVRPHSLPALADRVPRLPVPVVFDHMGFVQPGMAAEAEALVHMVRAGAWVKLSGLFRLSREGPPHADTWPLLRALVQAAPTRCLWGSDWPHVAFRGAMPCTGDLLDALAGAVPDAATRHAILTTNPQRLYGLPAPDPTC